jgi:NAD(P)-dependent dehydrogenase (short-subunit alcohol dehydrogenase family)
MLRSSECKANVFLNICCVSPPSPPPPGECADGEPEEIAKAVLFFASDGSSFVNTENMVVDGGFSLV